MCYFLLLESIEDTPDMNAKHRRGRPSRPTYPPKTLPTYLYISSNERQTPPLFHSLAILLYTIAYLPTYYCILTIKYIYYTPLDEFDLGENPYTQTPPHIVCARRLCVLCGQQCETLSTLICAAWAALHTLHKQKKTSSRRPCGRLTHPHISRDNQDDDDADNNSARSMRRRRQQSKCVLTCCVRSSAPSSSSCFCDNRWVCGCVCARVYNVVQECVFCRR